MPANTETKLNNLNDRLTVSENKIIHLDKKLDEIRDLLKSKKIEESISTAIRKGVKE